MRKLYRDNAKVYINDISEFSDLDIIESVNAFAAKM